MSLFRGILTVLLLILFVGLCVWIFSRKRKKQYDDAAKMALDSHHSDKKQEVKRDE
ncbi:cbb3-type cytochrome c oxidase subunit 3 [Kangiella japonica]|uniref:cbb3-type cytochrome oxidase subunit 3 n=1 Tax=Kangiella japonica TaxID=647384 RepID=UPI0031D9D211